MGSEKSTIAGNLWEGLASFGQGLENFVSHPDQALDKLAKAEAPSVNWNTLAAAHKKLEDAQQATGSKGSLPNDEKVLSAAGYLNTQTAEGKAVAEQVLQREKVLLTAFNATKQGKEIHPKEGSNLLYLRVAENIYDKAGVSILPPAEQIAHLQSSLGLSEKQAKEVVANWMNRHPNFESRKSLYYQIQAEQHQDNPPLATNLYRVAVAYDPRNEERHYEAAKGYLAIAKEHPGQSFGDEKPFDLAQTHLGQLFKSRDVSYASKALLLVRESDRIQPNDKEAAKRTSGFLKVAHDQLDRGNKRLKELGNSNSEQSKAEVVVLTETLLDLADEVKTVNPTTAEDQAVFHLIQGDLRELYKRAVEIRNREPGRPGQAAIFQFHKEEQNNAHQAYEARTAELVQKQHESEKSFDTGVKAIQTKLEESLNPPEKGAPSDDQMKAAGELLRLDRELTEKDYPAWTQHAKRFAALVDRLQDPEKRSANTALLLRDLITIRDQQRASGNIGEVNALLKHWSDDLVGHLPPALTAKPGAKEATAHLVDLLVNHNDQRVLAHLNPKDLEEYLEKVEVSEKLFADAKAIDTKTPPPDPEKTEKKKKLLVASLATLPTLVDKKRIEERLAEVDQLIAQSNDVEKLKIYAAVVPTLKELDSEVALPFRKKAEEFAKKHDKSSAFVDAAHQLQYYRETMAVRSVYLALDDLAGVQRTKENLDSTGEILELRLKNGEFTRLDERLEAATALLEIDHLYFDMAASTTTRVGKYFSESYSDKGIKESFDRSIKVHLPIWQKAMADAKAFEEKHTTIDPETGLKKLDDRAMLAHQLQIKEGKAVLEILHHYEPFTRFSKEGPAAAALSAISPLKSAQATISKLRALATEATSQISDPAIRSEKIEQIEKLAELHNTVITAADLHPIDTARALALEVASHISDPKNRQLAIDKIEALYQAEVGLIAKAKEAVVGSSGTSPIDAEEFKAFLNPVQQMLKQELEIDVEKRVGDGLVSFMEAQKLNDPKSEEAVEIRREVTQAVVADLKSLFKEQLENGSADELPQTQFNELVEKAAIGESQLAIAKLEEKQAAQETSKPKSAKQAKAAEAKKAEKRQQINSRYMMAAAVFARNGLKERAAVAMEPLVQQAEAHPPLERLVMLNKMVEIYQTSGLTDEANQMLQKVVDLDRPPSGDPEIHEAAEIARASQACNKGDFYAAHEILVKIPDSPAAQQFAEAIQKTGRTQRVLETVKVLQTIALQSIATAKEHAKEHGINNIDAVERDTVEGWQEVSRLLLTGECQSLDEALKRIEVGGRFKNFTTGIGSEDPNGKFKASFGYEGGMSVVEGEIRNFVHEVNDFSGNERVFVDRVLNFADQLIGESQAGIAMEIYGAFKDHPLVGKEAHTRMTDRLREHARFEAAVEIAKNWTLVGSVASMFLSGANLEEIKNSPFELISFGVGGKLRIMAGGMHLVRAARAARAARYLGSTVGRHAANWAIQKTTEATAITLTNMTIESATRGSLENWTVGNFLKGTGSMLVMFGTIHVGGMAMQRLGKEASRIKSLRNSKAAAHEVGVHVLTDRAQKVFGKLNHATTLTTMTISDYESEFFGLKDKDPTAEWMGFTDRLLHSAVTDRKMGNSMKLLHKIDKKSAARDARLARVSQRLDIREARAQTRARVGKAFETIQATRPELMNGMRAAAHARAEAEVKGRGEDPTKNPQEVQKRADEIVKDEVKQVADTVATVEAQQGRAVDLKPEDLARRMEELGEVARKRNPDPTKPADPAVVRELFVYSYVRGNGVNRPLTAAELGRALDRIQTAGENYLDRTGVGQLLRTTPEFADLVQGMVRFTIQNALPVEHVEQMAQAAQGSEAELNRTAQQIFGDANSPAAQMFRADVALGALHTTANPAELRQNFARLAENAPRIAEDLNQIVRNIYGNPQGTAAGRPELAYQLVSVALNGATVPGRGIDVPRLVQAVHQLAERATPELVQAVDALLNTQPAGQGGAYRTAPAINVGEARLPLILMAVVRGWTPEAVRDLQKRVGEGTVTVAMENGQLAIKEGGKTQGDSQGFSGGSQQQQQESKKDSDPSNPQAKEESSSPAATAESKATESSFGKSVVTAWQSIVQDLARIVGRNPYPEVEAAREARLKALEAADRKNGKQSAGFGPMMAVLGPLGKVLGLESAASGQTQASTRTATPIFSGEEAGKILITGESPKEGDLVANIASVSAEGGLFTTPEGRTYTINCMWGERGYAGVEVSFQQARKLGVINEKGEQVTEDGMVLSREELQNTLIEQRRKIIIRENSAEFEKLKSEMGPAEFYPLPEENGQGNIPIGKAFFTEWLGESSPLSSDSSPRLQLSIRSVEDAAGIPAVSLFLSGIAGESGVSPFGIYVQRNGAWIPLDIRTAGVQVRLGEVFAIGHGNSPEENTFVSVEGRQYPQRFSGLKLKHHSSLQASIPRPKNRTFSSIDPAQPRASEKLLTTDEMNLETGKVYSLGRNGKNNIVVNDRSISRDHLLVRSNEDGSVTFKNLVDSNSIGFGTRFGGMVQGTGTEINLYPGEKLAIGEDITVQVSGNGKLKIEGLPNEISSESAANVGKNIPAPLSGKTVPNSYYFEGRSPKEIPVEWVGVKQIAMPSGSASARFYLEMDSATFEPVEAIFEAPLVKAGKILRDKNVVTVASSANETKWPHTSLHFGPKSLSPENVKILLSHGARLKTDWYGTNYVVEIDATRLSPAEVEAKYAEIADALKPQELMKEVDWLDAQGLDENYLPKSKTPVPPTGNSGGIGRDPTIANEHAQQFGDDISLPHQPAERAFTGEAPNLGGTHSIRDMNAAPLPGGASKRPSNPPPLPPTATARVGEPVRDAAKVPVELFYSHSLRLGSDPVVSVGDLTGKKSISISGNIEPEHAELIRNSEGKLFLRNLSVITGTHVLVKGKWVNIEDGGAIASVEGLRYPIKPNQWIALGDPTDPATPVITIKSEDLREGDVEFKKMTLHRVEKAIQNSKKPALDPAFDAQSKETTPSESPWDGEAWDGPPITVQQKLAHQRAQKAKAEQQAARARVEEVREKLAAQKKAAAAAKSEAVPAVRPKAVPPPLPAEIAPKVQVPSVPGKGEVTVSFERSSSAQPVANRRPVISPAVSRVVSGLFTFFAVREGLAEKVNEGVHRIAEASYRGAWAVVGTTVSVLAGIGYYQFFRPATITDKIPVNFMPVDAQGFHVRQNEKPVAEVFSFGRDNISKLTSWATRIHKGSLKEPNGVSRSHFKLVRSVSDDSMQLIDGNGVDCSGNGTYIQRNGQWVRLQAGEKHKLQPNELFAIGFGTEAKDTMFFSYNPATKQLEHSGNMSQAIPRMNSTPPVNMKAGLGYYARINMEEGSHVIAGEANPVDSSSQQGMQTGASAQRGEVKLPIFTNEDQGSVGKLLEVSRGSGFVKVRNLRDHPIYIYDPNGVYEINKEPYRKVEGESEFLLPEDQSRIEVVQGNSKELQRKVILNLYPPVFSPKEGVAWNLTGNVQRDGAAQNAVTVRRLRDENYQERVFLSVPKNVVGVDRFGPIHQATGEKIEVSDGTGQWGELKFGDDHSRSVPLPLGTKEFKIRMTHQDKESGQSSETIVSVNLKGTRPLFVEEELGFEPATANRYREIEPEGVPATVPAETTTAPSVESGHDFTFIRDLKAPDSKDKVSRNPDDPRSYEWTVVNTHRDRYLYILKRDPTGLRTGQFQGVTLLPGESTTVQDRDLLMRGNGGGFRFKDPHLGKRSISANKAEPNQEVDRNPPAGPSMHEVPSLSIPLPHEGEIYTLVRRGKKPLEPHQIDIPDRRLSRKPNVDLVRRANGYEVIAPDQNSEAAIWVKKSDFLAANPEAAYREIFNREERHESYTGWVKLNPNERIPLSYNSEFRVGGNTSESGLPLVVTESGELKSVERSEEARAEDTRRIDNKTGLPEKVDTQTPEPQAVDARSQPWEAPSAADFPAPPVRPAPPPPAPKTVEPKVESKIESYGPSPKVNGEPILSGTGTPVGVGDRLQVGDYRLAVEVKDNVRVLVIEEDGGGTKVVPLDSPGVITIGRAKENVIRLTERNISRRHLELVVGEDGSIIARRPGQQGQAEPVSSQASEVAKAPEQVESASPASERTRMEEPAAQREVPRIGVDEPTLRQEAFQPVPAAEPVQAAPVSRLTRGEGPDLVFTPRSGETEIVFGRTELRDGGEQGREIVSNEGQKIDSLDTVSRKHATFVKNEQGQWYVHHGVFENGQWKESQAGTKVTRDGQPVQPDSNGYILLAEGDLVNLGGHHQIVFSHSEAARQAKAETAAAVAARQPTPVDLAQLDLTTPVRVRPAGMPFEVRFVNGHLVVFADKGQLVKMGVQEESQMTVAPNTDFEVAGKTYRLTDSSQRIQHSPQLQAARAQFLGNNEGKAIDIFAQGLGYQTEWGPRKYIPLVSDSSIRLEADAQGKMYLIRPLGVVQANTHFRLIRPRGDGGWELIGAVVLARPDALITSEFRIGDCIMTGQTVEIDGVPHQPYYIVQHTAEGRLLLDVQFQALTKQSSGSSGSDGSSGQGGGRASGVTEARAQRAASDLRPGEVRLPGRADAPTSRHPLPPGGAAVTRQIPLPPARSPLDVIRNFAQQLQHSPRLLGLAVAVGAMVPAAVTTAFSAPEIFARHGRASGSALLELAGRFAIAWSSAVSAGGLPLAIAGNQTVGRTNAALRQAGLLVVAQPGKDPVVTVPTMNHAMVLAEASRNQHWNEGVADQSGNVSYQIGAVNSGSHIQIPGFEGSPFTVIRYADGREFIQSNAAHRLVVKDENGNILTGGVTILAGVNQHYVEVTRVKSVTVISGSSGSSKISAKLILDRPESIQGGHLAAPVEKASTAPAGQKVQTPSVQAKPAKAGFYAETANDPSFGGVGMRVIEVSPDAELKVGRAEDAQVVSSAAGVSRNHLSVKVENGEVVVTVDGANGIYVGGQHVRQGEVLRLRTPNPEQGVWLQLPTPTVGVPGEWIAFKVSGSLASTSAKAGVGVSPASAPVKPATITQQQAAGVAKNEPYSVREVSVSRGVKLALGSTGSSYETVIIGSQARGVSGKHLEIEEVNGQLIATVLGRNGIYIDGNLIPQGKRVSVNAAQGLEVQFPETPEDIVNVHPGERVRFRMSDTLAPDGPWDRGIKAAEKGRVIEETGYVREVEVASGANFTVGSSPADHLQVEQRDAVFPNHLSLSEKDGALHLRLLATRHGNAKGTTRVFMEVNGELIPIGGNHVFKAEDYPHGVKIWLPKGMRDGTSTLKPGELLILRTPRMKTPRPQQTVEVSEAPRPSTARSGDQPAYTTGAGAQEAVAGKRDAVISGQIGSSQPVAAASSLSMGRPGLEAAAVAPAVADARMTGGARSVSGKIEGRMTSGGFAAAAAEQAVPAPEVVKTPSGRRAASESGEAEHRVPNVASPSAQTPDVRTMGVQGSQTQSGELPAVEFREGEVAGQFSFQGKNGGKANFHLTPEGFVNLDWYSLPNDIQGKRSGYSRALIQAGIAEAGKRAGKPVAVLTAVLSGTNKERFLEHGLEKTPLYLTLKALGAISVKVRRIGGAEGSTFELEARLIPSEAELPTQIGEMRTIDKVSYFAEADGRYKIIPSKDVRILRADQTVEVIASFRRGILNPGDKLLDNVSGEELITIPARKDEVKKSAEPVSPLVINQGEDAVQPPASVEKEKKEETPAINNGDARAATRLVPRRESLLIKGSDEKTSLVFERRAEGDSLLQNRSDELLELVPEDSQGKEMEAATKPIPPKGTVYLTPNTVYTIRSKKTGYIARIDTTEQKVESAKKVPAESSAANKAKSSPIKDAALTQEQVAASRRMLPIMVDGHPTLTLPYEEASPVNIRIPVNFKGYRQSSAPALTMTANASGSMERQVTNNTGQLLFIFRYEGVDAAGKPRYRSYPDLLDYEGAKKTQSIKDGDKIVRRNEDQSDQNQPDYHLDVFTLRIRGEQADQAREKARIEAEEKSAADARLIARFAEKPTPAPAKTGPSKPEISPSKILEVDLDTCDNFILTGGKLNGRFDAVEGDPLAIQFDNTSGKPLEVGADRRAISPNARRVVVRDGESVRDAEGMTLFTFHARGKKAIAARIASAADTATKDKKEIGAVLEQARDLARGQTDSRILEAVAAIETLESSTTKAEKVLGELSQSSNELTQQVEETALDQARTIKRNLTTAKNRLQQLRALIAEVNQLPPVYEYSETDRNLKFNRDRERGVAVITVDRSDPGVRGARHQRDYRFTFDAMAEEADLAILDANTSNQDLWMVNPENPGEIYHIPASSNKMYLDGEHVGRIRVRDGARFYSSEDLAKENNPANKEFEFQIKGKGIDELRHQKTATMVSEAKKELENLKTEMNQLSAKSALPGVPLQAVTNTSMAQMAVSAAEKVSERLSAAEQNPDSQKRLDEVRKASLELRQAIARAKEEIKATNRQIDGNKAEEETVKLDKNKDAWIDSSKEGVRAALDSSGRRYNFIFNGTSQADVVELNENSSGRILWMVDPANPSAEPMMVGTDKTTGQKVKVPDGARFYISKELAEEDNHSKKEFSVRLKGKEVERIRQQKVKKMMEDARSSLRTLEAKRKAFAEKLSKSDLPREEKQRLADEVKKEIGVAQARLKRAYESGKTSDSVEALDGVQEQLRGLNRLVSGAEDQIKRAERQLVGKKAEKELVTLNNLSEAWIDRGEGQVHTSLISRQDGYAYRFSFEKTEKVDEVVLNENSSGRDLWMEDPQNPGQELIHIPQGPASRGFKIPDGAKLYTSKEGGKKHFAFIVRIKGEGIDELRTQKAQAKLGELDGSKQKLSDLEETLIDLDGKDFQDEDGQARDVIREARKNITTALEAVDDARNSLSTSQNTAEALEQVREKVRVYHEAVALAEVNVRQVQNLLKPKEVRATEIRPKDAKEDLNRTLTVRPDSPHRIVATITYNGKEYQCSFFIREIRQSPLGVVSEIVLMNTSLIKVWPSNSDEPTKDKDFVLRKGDRIYITKDKTEDVLLFTLKFEDLVPEGSGDTSEGVKKKI